MSCGIVGRAAPLWPLLHDVATCSPPLNLPRHSFGRFRFCVRAPHHPPLQARLSAAVRDHEVASLRLGSRLGALEAALEGGRLREGSLEREAGALREDLERARGTAAELQVGGWGGQWHNRVCTALASGNTKDPAGSRSAGCAPAHVVHRVPASWPARLLTDLRCGVVQGT